MSREMSLKELESIIYEVAEKVQKDLDKVKADEVEPDEYADTLAHKVDYEKELDINPDVSGNKVLEGIQKKESEAVRMAKTLRAQRKKLQENMERKRLQEENVRLRKMVKKLKSK